MKELIITCLALLLHAIIGTTVNCQTLPLDPAVRTGKLDNGFTYFIRHNAEPSNRVQLYLANKVGSILETEKEQGLAHFMEHMNFNGTKHFPKNELIQYLQKVGVRFGSDLNAYTSFDETVYQLPIPTDDAEIFKNGMQIMRDWAQEATLASDEIDKERGVILEEKRQAKGASQRMQDKYLPVILNNSLYAKRLPIGTEEVLKNFDHETIRQFYKKWYRPDLQALIVVGDIDVNQVEMMIKEKFSDLTMPSNPPKRESYKVALKSKNQFISVTDPEYTNTVLQVYIKHPELIIKNSKEYNEAIKHSLLNQIIAARYYELMQQAEAPFIKGGAKISGMMAGMDAFNASVVAKPGELESGFKSMWREIERLSRFGVTQTELDRAKDSYMIAMESAFKEKNKTKSENLVSEYLEYFLTGHAAPGIEVEYELVTKQLPAITLKDMKKVIKQYITETNRDIIVMAPEKEKNNLPTQQTVNQWMSDLKKEQLLPYEDKTSDKPLVEKIPDAGKVIKEGKISELNITELTLNNGVKVILKPTDFKNDEIRFYSFSPGGTSLYNDEIYQSANNAAGIISSSGLGEFNSIELQKLLNGKTVKVTPYIKERSEGVQGITSPKDLQTALQLVSLYYTAPRKDETVFSGIISRNKSALANRSVDPMSVFSDTVIAVLGNHNTRRTGPTIKKLEQINLDQAFNIYKERFANAGDFTFVFTGNFKIDEIKPLLETWLGSLPSNNTYEKAVDLGIKIPSGIIEKKVYKGSDLKATVMLVFSGDYTYNKENNLQLDALGDIMQYKLTERLRELESGVYSPSARMNYSKYPSASYSVSVNFGCSIENVDKLVNATLDEINKLKTSGATEVDIQKFINENTRNHELQMKDNGFWIRYLGTSYENLDDPREILEFTSQLPRVTNQSVKETAIKYLDGKNMIKFVLLPEIVN